MCERRLPVFAVLLMTSASQLINTQTHSSQQTKNTAHPDITNALPYPPIAQYILAVIEMSYVPEEKFNVAISLKVPNDLMPFCKRMKKCIFVIAFYFIHKIVLQLIK